MSDQDTRNEIVRRAWDGETFAQIAADLGLGAYRVAQVARASEFPERAEMLELQGDFVVATYALCEDVTETARRVALNPQTVRNTLHARGVKSIRRQSGAAGVRKLLALLFCLAGLGCAGDAPGDSAP